jgi:hypothetical protein
MHPYRENAPAQHDVDADVRAFGRRVRAMRRRSVAVALTGAVIAAVGLLDWPLAANFFSGRFLKVPARAIEELMRTCQ